MKAFLFLLVLAAAAAAVWFLFLTGGGFDVSGEHPLGTFEAIRSALAKRDMPMEAADEDQVRSFFGDDVADRGGTTAVKFLGHAPRFPHFVLVVRDASGKVVACGGQGRSSMLEYSTTGPKTIGFLAKYWVEVSGSEPTFRDEQFAANSEAVRMRCDHRRGRISGSWVKDWGGGMRIAHQVVDRILFVLQ